MLRTNFVRWIYLGPLIILPAIFLSGCIDIACNLEIFGRRITVHDYTNVILKPCHLLVLEGTPGAKMISYTGRFGLGKGGSDQYPLDDTWRDGQFLPTPEAHAEFFDRCYFQIYGTATFDLGGLYRAVYVALSHDHGPYPEEALEYRLWISQDGINFSLVPPTTTIILYRRGWSAMGENLVTGEVLPEAEPPGQGQGNGPWADVLNDDYTALWYLPEPARFVRITPLSEYHPYNEPEVDAIMGKEPVSPSFKFKVGDVVKTTGVGDAGLNVREEPGGKIIKTVPDGWVFRILGGPVVAAVEDKSYSWWKVREESYEPSPVEGWVAEDFLEITGQASLVPAEPPDYFILASSQIEAAISWAESQTGKADWSGYCLKFVANAFGQASSGWASPREAKEKLGERFYPSTNCWNPPRGSLVFFSASGKWCDASYGCIDFADYGHIGIYLGQGKVIHAYGTVKVQSIREIEGLTGTDKQGNKHEIGSWIGWAYPPPEWLK